MKFVLSSLSLITAAVSAASVPRDALEKRASDFKLYAYGGSTEANAIGGLPVIEAHNMAYIGNGIPPNATSTGNVTFDMTDSQLTATNMDDKKLYIHTDNSELKQSGFASAANTTTTVTGFHLLGETVYWSSDDTYETYFYALPTNSSGVYSLVWGADGQSTDDAIPVALRSVAPSSAS